MSLLFFMNFNLDLCVTNKYAILFLSYFMFDRSVLLFILSFLWLTLLFIHSIKVNNSSGFHQRIPFETIDIVLNRRMFVCLCVLKFLWFCEHIRSVVKIVKKYFISPILVIKYKTRRSKCFCRHYPFKEPTVIRVKLKDTFERQILISPIH